MEEKIVKSRMNSAKKLKKKSESLVEEVMNND